MSATGKFGVVNRAADKIEAEFNLAIKGAGRPSRSEIIRYLEDVWERASTEAYNDGFDDGYWYDR